MKLVLVLNVSTLAALSGSVLGYAPLLTAVKNTIPHGRIETLWSKKDKQNKVCFLQRTRVNGPKLPCGLLSRNEGNIVKQAAHNSEGDLASDTVRWQPLSLVEKVLLPVQLVFGIYLLLLLPSGVATNKLCGARVMGTLPYEYIGFFSLLLLPRAYRYGKFADMDSASNPSIPPVKGRGASFVETIAFISALVGTHWKAAFQFAASSISPSMSATAMLGLVRLASTFLITWSGWTLGKSYDRIARPDELIQEGPYGYIRHPIYTSYLLLFSSTLLTLRSYGSLAVLLSISSIFYHNRMNSEEQLLIDSFGEKYEEYKHNVPYRLVPFVY